jgi:hypothetical protein
MSVPWFSNKGQVIQTGFAAIGCLVALCTLFAIPPTSFLNYAAPAIAIGCGIWLAFLCGRIMSSKNQYSAAQSSTSKVETKGLTSILQPVALSNDPAIRQFFSTKTLRVGERVIFRPDFSSFADVTIILKEVLITDIPTGSSSRQGAIECADLHCDISGNVLAGGQRTKMLEVNRFVCPVQTDVYHSEEESLVAYSFSEDHFHFTGIRVDHVNMHAKEAEITVCILRRRVS